MRTTSKHGPEVTALFIAFACLVASPSASADIYKWVDEQGKVHYGDVPKGQAERLQRTPLGIDADSDALETQSPPGTKPPLPSKETPFAMGKPDATADERCKEFQARVERYKDAGDMFIDQPDGTRHKLADEERQRLISRTQTQADKACSE